MTEVSKRVPKASYDTWIAPSEAEITENNTLKIYATTDFAVKWIKERYEIVFVDVLKELTGQAFKLDVSTLENKVDPNDNIKNEQQLNPRTKQLTVTVGTIHPSPSSIKLRADNLAIMKGSRRSVNLPLAKIGMSNWEKKVYADNRRIQERIQAREDESFGLFKLFSRCKE